MNRWLKSTHFDADSDQRKVGKKLLVTRHVDFLGKLLNQAVGACNKKWDQGLTKKPASQMNQTDKEIRAG